MSTFSILADSSTQTPELRPGGEETRPTAPPPIATFEEWTKEKLMHKDKLKRQPTPAPPAPVHAQTREEETRTGVQGAEGGKAKTEMADGEFRHSVFINMLLVNL